MKKEEKENSLYPVGKGEIILIIMFIDYLSLILFDELNEKYLPFNGSSTFCLSGSVYIKFLLILQ